MQGCRMPGQRASKQDNNRKPTVPSFIPNHTPRSGLSPAHSSSPHTPLLPALSISLSEINACCLLKWKRKAGDRHLLSTVVGELIG